MSIRRLGLYPIGVINKKFVVYLPVPLDAEEWSKKRSVEGGGSRRFMELTTDGD